MGISDDIRHPIRFARRNKAHIVACLGYALFLATNATTIWGGVFPFLPERIQTPAFLAAFFISQSTMFGLCLIGSSALAYSRPKHRGQRTLLPTCAVCFAGWACLLAAIYLPESAFALGIVGGSLIGFAAGRFTLAWQHIFSGQKAREGNLDLLVGTLLAPLVYFSLYLIPIAVTSLLIPLVFMPVYALCITLAERTLAPKEDNDTPDHPADRAQACRRFIADYWRSAVSIGSLAFACGIARSMALSAASTAQAVNNASMAALLAATALALILWRSRPLRINIAMFFRAFFPVCITAFVLLAALGTGFLTPLASILYGLYVCAVALVAAQAAQAARDRSIDPAFTFGAVAGAVYALHDTGFIVGLLAEGATFAGMDGYASVSFTTVYLLALMFFVVQGGYRQAISPSGRTGEHVELILWGDIAPRARASAGYVEDATAERTRAESPYLDRVSKQCLLLARQFKLSAREAQVVEALARGDIIPGIAKAMGLSENTVRTHVKRIYAKIDVHKKQELLDLVRSFNPEALVDHVSTQR